MIPPCDHTGMSHFHSSTTSGSASLMRARMRASVSPRQSPSFLMCASINLEGGASAPPIFGLFLFMAVIPILFSHFLQEPFKTQKPRILAGSGKICAIEGSHILLGEGGLCQAIHKACFSRID